MAEEFYGYVRRQAGDQVNWSQIGQDMSKTFEAENKRREDEKAALDSATNKSLTELQKVPMGLDAEKNQFIGNYSSNMTKALLLQSKLLKSGKISPKDFMIANANANSSTQTLFGLKAEYDKQYAIKQGRMNSPDPKTRSQAIEFTSMGYLEEFGDLSKSDALIDPTTLNANVAIWETDKNGVKVATNKIMPVGNVHIGLSQKYDYFDTSEVSKNVAGRLAPVIKTVIEAGGISEKGQIITIEDALQKDNTKAALDKMVDSYFTNPYNITSILTEDIGDFKPVYSKEEFAKDPEHSFLMTQGKDGRFVPELSDKQKEIAKEYLLTITKAQVKEKVDIALFDSPIYQQRKLQIEEQRARAYQKSIDNQSGNSPQGQSWVQKVDSMVPQVGTGKLVNETFIRDANRMLGGLGLEFISEGKTAGETVIIVDTESNPGYADKVKSKPFNLKTPQARQQILDYIVTLKADKAKELVGVGDVDKKNMTPSSGGKKKFKGFDANGDPILE